MIFLYVLYGIFKYLSFDNYAGNVEVIYYTMKH